jgi:hypothetical protein
MGSWGAFLGSKKFLNHKTQKKLVLDPPFQSFLQLWFFCSLHRNCDVFLNHTWDEFYPRINGQCEGVFATEIQTQCCKFDYNWKCWKTIKHQIFGCCTNLYQEIKIPLKCRRQCRVLIAFVCLTTSRSAILFSILLPKSSGTHSFASFNNN